MQRNAESNLVSSVRKAYYKDWRAKNKDKVKQHNLNFWNKKALQSQVVDDTENK